LVNELEENVEPLLRRQVSVKLVIRRFGIFKAAEHLNDSFHEDDFSTLMGAPPYGLGPAGSYRAEPRRGCTSSRAFERRRGTRRGSAGPCARKHARAEE